MLKFEKYYKKIQWTLKDYPDDFPSSYLPMFDLNEYSPKEILANFKPSPTALTMKYCRKEILSWFEQDRIWAEGIFETFRVLWEQMPPADPILIKLANRLEISLHPNPIIL
jgi:hypothetical protein